VNFFTKFFRNRLGILKSGMWRILVVYANLVDISFIRDEKRGFMEAPFNKIDF